MKPGPRRVDGDSRAGVGEASDPESAGFPKTEVPVKGRGRSRREVLAGSDLGRPRLERGSGVSGEWVHVMGVLRGCVPRIAV